MRTAARSPRALVSELLGERGYGSGRLALFEVSSPATHFYAGRTLRKFARDPGMQRYPGFEPVSDLEEYVRGADGDVVLLAPETLVEGLREWAAEAGLVLEVIEAEASFALNSGKSPIVALEVGVAGGPAAMHGLRPVPGRRTLGGGRLERHGKDEGYGDRAEGLHNGEEP